MNSAKNFKYEGPTDTFLSEMNKIRGERLKNSRFEQFMPIPYNPQYSITSYGRVFNKDGFELNPFPSRNTSNLKAKGQFALCVDIYNKDATESQQFYVHRLVAEAFCDKTEGSVYVLHLNGNNRDNMHTNLEWSSYKTAINCVSCGARNPLCHFQFTGTKVCKFCRLNLNN